MTKTARLGAPFSQAAGNLQCSVSGVVISPV